MSGDVVGRSVSMGDPSTGTCVKARSTSARSGAVFEVADGDDDEIARDVRIGKVASDGFGVERRHAVGRAQYRPPERMPAPETFGKELVDEIVGRVLDHLDLFEDDLLLALDLLGREGRPGDEVGQQIDAQAAGARRAP